MKKETGRKEEKVSIWEHEEFVFERGKIPTFTNMDDKYIVNGYCTNCFAEFTYVIKRGIQKEKLLPISLCSKCGCFTLS